MESTDPAELAVLDKLATIFLERVAPIRFDTARTPSERDAVYRLRYQAVIDRGWRNPEDLPDGREHDAYDDDAVHVVGWDGEVLVATARLVFPDSTRPLPTEDAFEIAIEPHGKVANVDRLTVSAAYSDRQHRVMLGLLSKIWQEIRARGLHIWAGIDAPAMTRLYRLIGFLIIPLAPARLYWGEERIPVLFDGLTGAPVAAARWKSLLGESDP